MGSIALDEKILAKYNEERDKRLRPEAAANRKFVDTRDYHFADLAKDPFIDYDALVAEEPTLKDGQKIKFLIVGAGISGVVHAFRLVQAGFKPSDIRIVDVSGGFGGTWYWNRYPGVSFINYCSIHTSHIQTLSVI